MSRIVDIENTLLTYKNYQSFTGNAKFDAGFDNGIFHLVDTLEHLPVLEDYKEITKKLWGYITMIDEENATYEELAQSIGLTRDEMAFCRRLEREQYED